jgi:Sporulation and spore germination
MFARKADMNRPSTHPDRRFIRLVMIPLTGLLLVACGISPDSSPQPINRKDVPYGLLDRPPATTPVSIPDAFVTIYLDGVQRLVAVSRPVPAPASVRGALVALGQGSTTAEAAQGLVSPISTAVPLLLVNLGAASATVDLSRSFANLGEQEEIVAVAQLVYTMTSFPGIRMVVIKIDGSVATVPTGTGTVTKKPVSRSDYLSLAPV